MDDWVNVKVFGAPPVGQSAVVRPSAYGILQDAGGFIAVVDTPRGCFLPGGGAQSYETPHETVIREFCEECGLNVEPGLWVTRAIDFVYSVDEASHFEKRSTFVDVHRRGGSSPQTEADHNLRWLEPTVAMSELSHPGHRWAVSEWRAR